VKKLTISEIAQLAGVSKATVSRVLNGYPHISAEVRQQVQKVITETGFQPNTVARLLATDRSNMIGLVIPTGPQAVLSVFTDPYFPTLTQGISQVANQNHLTLALFIFHSEQEGHEKFKSILTTGLLDGLIITADRKDDYYISVLNEYEMPFVLIGRLKNMEDFTSIDTDNFGGGYMATKHLIDLGYHRIGTVSSKQNFSGEARYDGYRRALEEHDIPFDERLVAFGDYSLDSGYNGARKIIPAKPDAVFAASDTMALGTIRALREAGLHVPNDVAVVGYDDLPPAVQSDPQLTTVQQPIEETGRLAVETLIELIDDRSLPPRHVILPNQLIVRASSGAVQLKSSYE
jgi:LacI family transcriptional regulator